MNFKALLITVIGAIVALFYGLESFMAFYTNGFTAPFFVKLLICGVGAHITWLNAKRVKESNGDGSSDNAI